MLFSAETGTMKCFFKKSVPSKHPIENNNISVTQSHRANKCGFKMKLNFCGMAHLVAELTLSEMWAIILLEFYKEMPDRVTKADLVKIIRVLCKKLNWIEVYPAEAETQKSVDEISVMIFFLRQS